MISPSNMHLRWQWQGIQPTAPVQASSRHYLTAVWRPWIPSPNSSPQDLHAISCNSVGQKGGLNLFVGMMVGGLPGWLLMCIGCLFWGVCVCARPFHPSLLFLSLSWTINLPQAINIKQHQSTWHNITQQHPRIFMDFQHLNFLPWIHFLEEKLRINTIA